MKIKGLGPGILLGFVVLIMVINTSVDAFIGEDIEIKGVIEDVTYTAQGGLFGGTITAVYFEDGRIYSLPGRLSLRKNVDVVLTLFDPTYSDNYRFEKIRYS